MIEHKDIVDIIRDHYPGTEAIYLFGSFDTGDERTDSDVDVAVLLSPDKSREHARLLLTPCHYALMRTTGRKVDLVNIRAVSTVFQTEIIRTGRLIYCVDPRVVAQFESMCLSYYQKLNE